MATSIISKLATRASETEFAKLGKTAFDGLIISGLEAMKKMSPTAGELAMVMKNAREAGDMGAGKARAALEANVGKLKGTPLYDQVTPHLDEGKFAVDPMARQAANAERQRLDSYLTKSLSYGLTKPTHIIQNYFPHTYDPMMFEGRGLEKAIKGVMASGLATDEVQAKLIIEKYGRGGRRAANLEIPRTVQLPGYEKDPMLALGRSYDDFERRFAEVEHFGKKDEKLTALMAQAIKEGASPKMVQAYVEHYLGRPVHTPHRVPGLTREPWERAVGSWEAASKLSLAVMSHPSQLLNVMVTTGLEPFVRGFTKSIVEYGDARIGALESSAIIDHARRTAARQITSRGDSMGSKLLRYTGFNWFDEWRRIMANSAGEFAVQKEFGNLMKNRDNLMAKRWLQWHGVDWKAALERGSLSEHDILLAGKRVADNTQFHIGIDSLPIFWRSSSTGRMMTMFKQYFYQQAKFMKDQVLKPAFAGDMRPLLYASLLFPTLGELAVDLRHYIRYGTIDDRPDWKKYPLDRLLDNAAASGALGIWHDIALSMSYAGKDMVTSFVVGPALSDVIDVTYTFTQPLRNPHPLNVMKKEIQRMATRRVPLVGQYAAHMQSKGWKKHKTGFQRGTVSKFLGLARNESEADGTPTVP